MPKSLIRKTQLHPDIVDLISGYGSLFFASYDSFNLVSGSISNSVYTTGNQTISGLKNFTIRPVVNGTQIILSGEAYPLTNPSGFITGVNLSNYYKLDNPSGFITSQNVVYTTGDQVISGNKTFDKVIKIQNFDTPEGINRDILIITGNISDGVTNTQIFLPVVSNDDSSLTIDGGGASLTLSPNSYVLYNNGAAGIQINGNEGLYLNSIYGNISFNKRPLVNGTGVLLSGETMQIDLSSTVLTTGDQIISGIKTFSAYNPNEPLEIFYISIYPSGDGNTITPLIKSNANLSIQGLNSNFGITFTEEKAAMGGFEWWGDRAYILIPSEDTYKGINLRPDPNNDDEWATALDISVDNTNTNILNVNGALNVNGPLNLSNPGFLDGGSNLIVKQFIDTITITGYTPGVPGVTGKYVRISGGNTPFYQIGNINHYISLINNSWQLFCQPIGEDEGYIYGADISFNSWYNLSEYFVGNLYTTNKTWRINYYDGTRIIDEKLLNNNTILRTTGNQVISGNKIFNDYLILNKDLYSNSDLYANSLYINGIFDQEDNSSSLEMHSGSIILKPNYAGQTGYVSIEPVGTVNGVLPEVELRVKGNAYANNLVYKTGNPMVVFNDGILFKKGDMSIGYITGSYNEFSEINQLELRVHPANGNEGYITLAYLSTALQIGEEGVYLNNFGGGPTYLRGNATTIIEDNYIYINSLNTNFNYRPRVNDTGVLLEGDVDINNIVYKTGDQILSGSKIFSTGGGSYLKAEKIYTNSASVLKLIDDPSNSAQLPLNVLYLNSISPFETTSSNINTTGIKIYFSFTDNNKQELSRHIRTQSITFQTGFNPIFGPWVTVAENIENCTGIIITGYPNRTISPRAFFTNYSLEDRLKHIETNGVFALLPNQKIGVGTHSPEEKLHIVGNLKLNGGLKTTNRPTVNGTGVLLVGDIVEVGSIRLTGENIVYTTGDQTISGVKTFSAYNPNEPLEILSISIYPSGDGYTTNSLIKSNAELSIQGSNSNFGITFTEEHAQMGGFDWYGDTAYITIPSEDSYNGITVRPDPGFGEFATAIDLSTENVNVGGILNVTTALNLNGGALNLADGSLDSGLNKNVSQFIDTITITGTPFVSGITGTYIRTSGGNTPFYQVGNINNYISWLGSSWGLYANPIIEDEGYLYGSDILFYSWYNLTEYLGGNLQTTNKTWRTNLYNGTRIVDENLLNNNTVVRTSGNQTISGIKTFMSRPTVNGTGILLSGEIAQADLSSTVRTTGNQTISGFKKFSQTGSFQSLFFEPTSIPGGGGLNGPQIKSTYYDGTTYGIGIFSTFGNPPAIDNQIANFNEDEINLYKITRFSQRPTVNSTGVLLQGEATQVDLSSTVRTTGNQTISGTKTFLTNSLLYSGVNVNFDSNTNVKFSGNTDFTKLPTVNNTGILLVGQNSVIFNCSTSFIAYSANTTGYFSNFNAGSTNGISASDRQMPILDNFVAKKYVYSIQPELATTWGEIKCTGYFINTTQQKTGIILTGLPALGAVTANKVYNYTGIINIPINAGDNVVCALNSIDAIPSMRSIVQIYLYN